MAGRIIVAGSVGMDIVARTDRVPAIGETVFGSESHFVLGGKGANQAIAARRLEGNVSFVGRVGDDHFGEVLKETLRKEKLDISNLRVTANTNSGIALIFVDSSAHNSIVVVPGSNWKLTPEDVGAVRITSSDIAVSVFETPQDTILSLFKRAKKAGAKTILNTAPAVDSTRELLSLADYLVFNEHEAAFYAKRKPTNDVEKVKKFADELSTRADQAIIITLGENGVYCKRGNEEITVPGRKVKAIDTTAAGDCFIGALATALSEGRSLRESLEFANAAASISVQRVGASSSLPTLFEVNQIL